MLEFVLNLRGGTLASLITEVHLHGHPNMYPLSLRALCRHQAELQAAQQENCRLNLELQEARGRQEEQSAQAQRLKDRMAQMKGTLGQAQQRVVSEAPRQQGVENVPGLVVDK